jgi:tetratricopeptide (TPR) repeat protein
MELFNRHRDRGGAGVDRVAEAKEAFARGQREFAAEHFDTAASIFRTVVALTPDSPNSQFMLGVSLFKAEDLEAALEPLRRCIALRPEHDDAHFILGVALGRMDKFKEAETHLARAASLGNQQAQERLPRVGADYCRRCARAVQISGNVEDADIIFLTPDDGLSCADCHTVLCTACAGMGPGPQPRPGCPDCGGRLRLLTR